MADTAIIGRAEASRSALGQPSVRVLRRFTVPPRGLAQAALDLAAWAIAIVLAAYLVSGAAGPGLSEAEFLAGFALVGMLATPLGLTAGLYTGRWQFGSFDEVLALVRVTVTAGAAAILIASSASWPGFSVRILSLAPPLALLLMFASRSSWRLVVDRRARPDAARAERLLVFGAGRAGQQIVASLLATPESKFLPVAILDDDPTTRRMRVKGVRVVGGRRDLVRAAADYGATRVLLAVPSGRSGAIRELVTLAGRAGLAVSVVPDLQDLVSGRAELTDIRDVSEADLLGRGAVRTDLQAAAGYIAGHRVLVTGAGGSIGAELCRQLAQLSPGQLVMLDRDESALHGVQLSMEGRALLDSPNLVVADIRDRSRLREIFASVRPDVVFHAAALKHLPLLEMHPSEAVKTNVWGTLNVLEEAERAGVTTFLNVSTDKAADPQCVLGNSKRIAERATAAIALRTGLPYLSVRFGNVIGSRGSVLVTFRSQIVAGGPVTLTHPDVTRFFMTIQEAVHLVIQAGAIGHPREVLVLDMGEPVHIADVARRLIHASGRDIPVIVTGLRRGEKLHERLVGSEEAVRPTDHPMIMKTLVPPIDLDDVLAIDVTDCDIRAALADVARRPVPDATRRLGQKPAVPV